MHGLWKKYIKPSSPNEINISGLDKELLGESLGDCQQLISDSEIGYDKLFELIEICRSQMEQLLWSNISRFEMNKF